MPVVLMLVGVCSCLFGVLLVFAGVPAGGSLGTMVVSVAPGVGAIVNGLLIIGASLGLEDLGRIAKASERMVEALHALHATER